MTHIKTALSPQGSPTEGHTDPETKRKECIARGGVWDSETNTCTIVEVDKSAGSKPVLFKGSQIEGRGFAIPLKETSGVAGTTAGANIPLSGTFAEQQAAREAEDLAIIEQQKEAQRQELGEEFPQRVELNPPKFGGVRGTEMPLLGGINRQVANTVGNILKASGIDKEGIIQESLGRMTEEQTNALAISDIQKNELKKGLTISEGFGALIEGVPGSKWLNKWFDIETPRGNLEEVFNDIKGMTSSIRNIQQAVRDKTMTIETAEMNLELMEQYITFQEARLGMLILNSPSLQFNSDRVNGFETDILTVRQRLFRAKGTLLDIIQEDPTSINIALKQEEQKVDGWATEPW